MARQKQQKKTVTDNPKLKWKKLSDGSSRAYLEYYLGYEFYLDEYGNKKLDEQGRPIVKPKRRKEFLKLTIPKKPSTPVERNQRDETLLLAEGIRREREKEFLENTEGYKFKKDKQNFFDFFDNYIKEYTKRDIRMIQIARKRFADFLASEKKYNLFELQEKPLGLLELKSFRH